MVTKRERPIANPNSLSAVCHATASAIRKCGIRGASRAYASSHCSESVPVFLGQEADLQTKKLSQLPATPSPHRPERALRRHPCNVVEKLLCPCMTEQLRCINILSQRVPPSPPAAVSGRSSSTPLTTDTPLDCAARAVLERRRPPTLP